MPATSRRNGSRTSTTVVAAPTTNTATHRASTAPTPETTTPRPIHLPKPDNEQSTPANEPEVEICRQYMRGHCEWGPRCHRFHPPDAAIRSEGVCKLYLAGRCFYGPQCKRTHPSDVDVPRPDRVCQDYLDGRCKRINCRHIHPPRETKTPPKTNEPVKATEPEKSKSSKNDPPANIRTLVEVKPLVKLPKPSVKVEAPSRPVTPKVDVNYWTALPDHSGWRLDSPSSDSDTAGSSSIYTPPTSNTSSPSSHPSKPPSYTSSPQSHNRYTAFPSQISRIPSNGTNGSCLRCMSGAGNHDSKCPNGNSKFPLIPPGLPPRQNLTQQKQQTTPKPVALTSPPRSSPPGSQLSVTVQDHTKVKLGPGFQILEVVTGFESRWVYLGNVPPSATQAALMPLLEEFGQVVQFKMPLDIKALKAPVIIKVQFSEPAEARQAAASLNGAQYKKVKLSARLPVNNSLRGNGMLRDSSVRLSWEAPVRVVFAGYSTLERAQAAVEQANNIELDGYHPSAAFHEGMPVIGDYNVRFEGLPPNVDEKMMERFGKPDEIMLERPNYPSLENAVKGVRALLERHGELLNLQVLPMIHKDKIVTAWAHFVSPHDAQTACEYLHGTRQNIIGRCHLWAHHLQDVSYALPGHVYDKLASDIFALREATWKHGLRTSVMVNDLRKPNPLAPVKIRLSGENTKELGVLKMQFEKILRGETVSEDGSTTWDDFFARSAGTLFVNELELEHPGVWIQVDQLRRTISLFGHVRSRAAVRLTILNKVAYLRGQQIRSIPLHGRLIGLFMNDDLLRVQEHFGPENIRLNLRTRCLDIRGNDNVYESVQQVLRRVQHRYVLGSRHHIRECPVCFDEVTSPVTLQCGHSWCRTCFSGYLVAATDNKLFPLTCLGNEATCSEPISLAVAQDVLPSAEFDALVNATYMTYIHSRPNEFHYCPTPDCHQIYRAAPEGSVLQCPSCLVRICPSCRVEAHDGMSCEDRDCEGEKLFKGWRATHDVKICPGCKASIERSEGCNHMTCTVCQTHICWECMATFPKGEGIYDHMRMMHGGIGL